MEVLHTVRCAAIRPDSLGNYLVGLGLLEAISREWFHARGCWRHGTFVAAAPDIGQESLMNFLVSRWEPPKYRRWWYSAQRADSGKSDANIQAARASATLDEVRTLDCHIVGVGKNVFNPVLGTGGNVARRDLEKTCHDAITLLSRAKASTREAWLKHTLFGTSEVLLPNLSSAGTWFVQANKIFNSGQQWYREGQLSPWSFLLALNGALMLSGGAARRLGSRARPYAVFPFVSESASPCEPGEAGKSRAEFWAPLWDRPATAGEVRALLARGQARVGSRAATAPYEFAAAARAAGVDAGVSEFARFTLRQTTSSQVYEAVPRQRIAATEAPNDEAALMLPIADWLRRLPFDKTNRFYGLRGPIEESIIDVAERPGEAERWRRLLLLVARTQHQIDRNKTLREICVPLEPLATGWLDRTWPEPTIEIEIARAIASIGSRTPQKTRGEHWRADCPIRMNIFGIEPDARGFRFPRERPARAVWPVAATIRALTDILERRLIDADTGPPPLGASEACDADGVAAFLAGLLDDEQILRWIPPLSLINWRATSCEHEKGTTSPDGTMLLFWLLKPFFHREELRVEGKQLFAGQGAPGAHIARRLLALVRSGALNDAASAARVRYRAANWVTIEPPDGLDEKHQRLAAAMLIPVRSRILGRGLERWLEPYKIEA